tara:strand:- start:405 stop:1505 length:1101 start_codon:yes stop_codon:yes gene_type:complete
MDNREIIQKKALDASLKQNRSGLDISMGVGKTRIAIQHLMVNYDPFIQVLVVIPKLSIKDSWFTELDKMNLSGIKEHITFTTYLSLNKKDPNGYDVVYLDECHNLLYKHKTFLEQYQGIILGLTGTAPIRKLTEKHDMVAKFCPIVYKFSVDDATDSNILNNYKIIIHEISLSKELTLKKKTKAGGHWYSSEVKDYKYCNQRMDDANTPKQQQFAAIMRMRALMSYNSKEFYAKTLLKNISDKCIIFANTKEQADKLCKHSYHSGNPSSEYNLELFSDGRIDKLSCVLQLSEGVTIPDLKQGIILHAYGNNRKSAQRIGRLLRLNPSDTAVCHILCYKNTQDENWVKTALKDFNQSKIKYFNPLDK